MITDEFTTDAAIKCREYHIVTYPTGRSADWERLLGREECQADPTLIQGEIGRFLDLGATHIRQTNFADGDVLIEAWKET